MTYISTTRASTLFFVVTGGQFCLPLGRFPALEYLTQSDTFKVVGSGGHLRPTPCYCFIAIVCVILKDRVFFNYTIQLIMHVQRGISVTGSAKHVVDFFSFPITSFYALFIRHTVRVLQTELSNTPISQCISLTGYLTVPATRQPVQCWIPFYNLSENRSI